MGCFLTLGPIAGPSGVIEGTKPVHEHQLTKGGNKKVTVKELPGLNHLFQESKTGLPTEYSTIEHTFSPTALSEISKWIEGQTK